MCTVIREIPKCIRPHSWVNKSIVTSSPHVVRKKSYCLRLECSGLPVIDGCFRHLGWEKPWKAQEPQMQHLNILSEANASACHADEQCSQRWLDRVLSCTMGIQALCGTFRLSTRAHVSSFEAGDSSEQGDLLLSLGASGVEI